VARFKGEAGTAQAVYRRDRVRVVPWLCAAAHLPILPLLATGALCGLLSGLVLRALVYRRV
jgi:hypothetical protein